MPNYLRGVEKGVLTFVSLNDSNMFYGFTTRDFTEIPGITQEDLDALGHRNELFHDALDIIYALPNKLAIFGANSPKPARYKKVINRNPNADQIGSISTFISQGRVYASSASARGWKFLSPAKGVSLTGNRRTTTALAQLSERSAGGFYGFPMNTADFELYEDELGLFSKAELTELERSRSFTGATRPQPPKVCKELSNGTKITTFASSGDALTSALVDYGWELLRDEVRY